MNMQDESGKLPGGCVSALRPIWQQAVRSEYGSRKVLQEEGTQHIKPHAVSMPLSLWGRAKTGKGMYDSQDQP